MSQKRFAFLFGANGPKGTTNLKPLQYAQNDIRHLKTAFSSSFCNFHQATDQIADTASVVLAQLERLAYDCERPDLLVVHFSGHGFVWNGQLYLLCNTTDVDAKLFNSTAINITQIKAVLDQCSAKHKLLILDCCFAGIAQGGGTWKSEEQLPGLESLKGSVNAILAACPAHQRTRELDTLELYQEKGAGFLSWAIARACGSQFSQVARQDALSLSDLLEWLPGQRNIINESLSPGDRIPAPRVLNQRDLVGDDEIWFTPRRRSNSSHEMVVEKRQHEEHALLQHVPFLKRPCTTASLEDFDAERVQKYAQHDGDTISLPVENLPKLCQQLGLTSTIGTPIMAAVLAFHKTPSRHLHSALIRATCYVADERDRYLKEDIEGPLGKQVEHALRWLLDNLRTISEHVDAEKRVDRCEIPEQALRELIANAVVHRDYEADESIQIRITPRQVTITNPGRLNPAIMNHEPSPFAYRESHPRNPLLLKVLIAERWAEGRSRGFEIVTEEFSKYDLILPEIKNLPENLVQVTIERPEFDVMFQAALPIWNVPYLRNLYFTGRETLLRNLHETLNTDNIATLTYVPNARQAIRGLGGIGKTQAAIEYAYRYRHDYEAVLWVKADTYENIFSDFMNIAELLKLPERKNPQRVVAAVKKWLSDHTKWLLIFDNADDLKVVQGFLPTSDKGHTLLTTRAYAVGPIATPVEIDTMEIDEGVLFLLQRAHILRPTDDDRRCAREIVQEVGGLPLALEQVGAYIEKTRANLSQYLDLYQAHRAELLKRPSELPSDYPYTVTTVWPLSFQKVEQANPAATELLRLCAFLDPDAIPEEMITGGTRALGPVLGPISSDQLRMNEIVEELLRFSLIRRNSQTGTLTIHRLVKAVIQDGMDKETQFMWAERAIRTVHHAFPDKLNDVKTWPQCQRCLPHALACAKLIDQYGLASPEAARLLNQTGYYLREQARYSEAEKFLLQALAISEKLGPEHILHTAQILNNQARLYFDQYMYIKAEPFYEKALAIREQKLGPENSNVAQSLNGLALNYWYEGKYEQAEPLYQRALSINKQKLGPEHDQTLYILNNQALLYRSQRKYEEAIKLNQHVLVIREKKFDPVHLEVAQSLQNLAVTYYEQGNQSKYEEAEGLLKRALAIREELLPEKHLQIARCLRYLALVYEVQDKDEKAEKCFKRALDILKELLGVDHSQTIETKEKYAALLRKMKQDEEAAILEAQIKAIQNTKSSED